MWTVTVLGSMKSAVPQTTSRSWSRLKTCRGRRARVSKKVELASREPLLLAGDEHRPRRGVDGEPVEGQRLPGRQGVSLARPPQNGAHATHQLLSAEGLDHVVVGAQLETGDAVDLGLPGRQHDHGRVGRGAQSSSRPHSRRREEASGRGRPGRAATGHSRRAPPGRRRPFAPRTPLVRGRSRRSRRCSVRLQRQGWSPCDHPLCGCAVAARLPSFLPLCRVENADAMRKSERVHGLVRIGQSRRKNAGHNGGAAAPCGPAVGRADGAGTRRHGFGSAGSRGCTTAPLGCPRQGGLHACVEMNHTAERPHCRAPRLRYGPPAASRRKAGVFMKRNGWRVHDETLESVACRCRRSGRGCARGATSASPRTAGQAPQQGPVRADEQSERQPHHGLRPCLGRHAQPRRQLRLPAAKAAWRPVRPQTRWPRRVRSPPPTRGRVLLAVNAGSNTVSLFRVHGDHLWLKQVAASGGKFPVSIAVHGEWVYVLNAGGQGSVQGYWLAGDHLWRMRFSHRALGLGNTNPPDYLHSPGQVGFTPDGRRLIVATKASTSAIDVFWVGRSRRAERHGGRPTPRRRRCPSPSPSTPVGRLVVVEAAMSHLSTYTHQPRQQPDRASARRPTASPRPAGSAPPAASTTSPTPAAATSAPTP